MAQMTQGTQKIRIVFFSSWANGLETAADYLAALPARNLHDRVTAPRNQELLRMARLDCDWDGECLRAFAAMTSPSPSLAFEPAWIADARGLLQFTTEGSFCDATPWLVLIGQRPGTVAPVIGRLLRGFRDRGGQVLFYSYDDASRTMPGYATDVAPYLSALIHDEEPLTPEVQRALPTACVTRRQSWVANIVPFAHPFDEAPDRRIVFLGSQLGLTANRLAQIQALEAHFKDRFDALTNHSVALSQRSRFAQIEVHLCPEGRKFGTPSMSLSHTDRPFWSGCVGQVPVSEDSATGPRLPELAAQGLILSYEHGAIQQLIERCEQALELPREQRYRIYEHFNREGTVGPVVAREIARFHGVRAESPSLAGQAST
jgi:hypothetical protein